MTDRDARIRNAVAAWRAEHPAATAELDALPADERAEALYQLGYHARRVDPEPQAERRAVSAEAETAPVCGRCDAVFWCPWCREWKTGDRHQPSFDEKDPLVPAGVPGLRRR